MDNTTAKKLINSRTFKTAVHNTANKLKISDNDARQLVFNQLMNRLKNKSWNIEDKLESNSQDLAWLITYSSRDAIRLYFQAEYKQQRVKDAIKDRQNSSLINLAGFKNETISDIEKVKIANLLPKIFSHQSTVIFTTSLIKVGRVRTIENLGLTEKQFDKKLSYVEKFCKTHNKKLVNLVVSRQDNKLICKEHILKRFIDLIEERYSDQQWQSLIDENRGYFEDLTGQISCLKQPVKVLNDWTNAPLRSEYKVVNKIYDEYEHLKKQLNESV